MATEFAFATVVDDATGDVFDPSTDAGQAVNHMIDTLLKYPGAREAHWAMAEENSKQMWVFVEWDKVQDHLDYRKTEQFADATRKLAPIIDVSAEAHISHVVPPICSVLKNPEYPAVEVLSLCFPADIDDDSKAFVEQRWADFTEAALYVPGLCKDISHGWTAESDVPLPGNPDKKGCHFVALISWASVEQHWENQATQAFKDNIGMITGLSNLIGIHMIHVKCKSKSSE